MLVHEALAGLRLYTSRERMNISRTTTMAIACATIACCSAVYAGNTDKTTKREVNDISLRSDGVLVGQVVNAQGEAVPGAKIKVMHGRDVIAETTSNRTGGFIVRKLRGGVHHVTAGQGSAVVKLWTNTAAPPSSRAALTIVSDKNVVRGQCGDSSCTGECGSTGCGEDAGPFNGLFGLGGGGMAGVAGIVATAAVVGGVLAVTLDDDDDPAPAPAPASP